MMWSISSSIRIIRCSSATPLPDRWSIVYHPLRSRPFSSDTHPSAPAAGRRGGAGSITCGDWAQVEIAGAIATVVPALMKSRRFISPPNACLLAFPYPFHRFFKRLALHAAFDMTGILGPDVLIRVPFRLQCFGHPIVGERPMRYVSSAERKPLSRDPTSSQMRSGFVPRIRNERFMIGPRAAWELRIVLDVHERS